MQVRRARGAVLAAGLGLAVLPSLVPDELALPALDVVVDVPTAAGRPRRRCPEDAARSPAPAGPRRRRRSPP